MIRLAAILALVATSAAAQPVSPVRLNQLGFQTGAAKIAVAPNPSRTPAPWRLLDASGQVRASGATRVVGDDAASGEHLHQADLSGFDAPGEGYRLEVGAAASRPFAISPHPFARLKSDALAYFYHNRSGVPIEARFVKDARWARPAGHAPDRATCFDKTDLTGFRWPGCSYTLDVSGGWYDAGDHGKYVVNGGIAVWTLMNAYERMQAKGTADAFADGRASIPEAGNGVNDLLDEARFELAFLLAMQVPDGARLAVPVGRTAPGAKPRLAEVDATGLVHHKVADEHWTRLPTAPHEDRETRYLYPPSTAATLNLAAVAAQGARIWRRLDPAFSARCLAAAEKAYAAAQRHPDIFAWNGFDGSGGYGDEDLTDERYWAAAELYATTGKPAYLADLRASPHLAGASPFAWPQTATLGTISLALADGPERPRMRQVLVAAAEGYLAEAGGEGYGVPYAGPAYRWGSNSDLLNRAIVLALAYDFTPRRAYRDAALASLDYVLGRNPLDRSYVSGYGARPMEHPHHRFWARSLDARYPPPPPGALSGGPNNSAMTDPVARRMRGACRPQTCWADDIQAYALNEVAINWNAPLVWVAAFLDER
jgi:endoglucanase